MRPQTSPPLVSVVIVSWNAQSYLTKCLASLNERAFAGPMEIIVVDNGSSDGSPESVEEKFPAVRLIRNRENLGFAKANNIGILNCRGRYVCLVNSDVEVAEGCIAHLVDYCEQQGDVGMAGPRILGCDGRPQPSCRGFPGVWNMFCSALALDTLFPGVRLFSGYSLSSWPQKEPRPVDILSGCFWLVRREALDEVGLLDESFFMYGEDMDWCKRFWERGWKVAFVPSAEATHYGGASSSNAPTRFFIERHRADLRYWRKHHSAAGVALYFGITCARLFMRAAGYCLAWVVGRPPRGTCEHKIHRSLACLGWMLTRGLKRSQ